MRFSGHFKGNVRVQKRSKVDYLDDTVLQLIAVKTAPRFSLCINLATPFRKNSRNRPYTSAKTKKKLKDRWKIENTFCRMGKFKRMFEGQERTILFFMSWNFLACAQMTGKYID